MVLVARSRSRVRAGTNMWSVQTMKRACHDHYTMSLRNSEIDDAHLSSNTCRDSLDSIAREAERVNCEVKAHDKNAMHGPSCRLTGRTREEDLDVPQEYRQSVSMNIIQCHVKVYNVRVSALRAY